VSRVAARRRRRLGLWWLWLPIGIALIAYAISTGSNLASYAGPFIIGCLLIIWGVAGALVWIVRDRTP
jgi:amino acid transporter